MSSRTRLGLCSPRTTASQVRGMALAMTKLVFAGDTAEVVETIRSNVRNIPQAT